MEYIIRKLREDDLEDGRGFLATVANMNDISDLSFSERKEIWLEAMKQNAYFFVAVSDEETYGEQIIATVKLIIEPKFFYGGKKAGHIEDVITRKGFEGMGLAKALLQTAITKAEEKGCYKVILDCDKSLVGFYTKSNFKDHEVCMRLDFKK